MVKDSTGTEARKLVQTLAELERLRESGGLNRQRQHRRFPIRADAELHPMDPGELSRASLEVKLRDIARGGAGFVTTAGLAVRSVWRLVLLTRGYAIGEIGLVVRHCREVSSGVHLVGGQFGIGTGFMAVLGVDPGKVARADEAGELDDDPHRFAAPDELQ